MSVRTNQQAPVKSRFADLRWIAASGAVALVLAAFACGSDAAVATVDIIPVGNSNTTGKLQLRTDAQQGGVFVEGTVRGLKPGQHAIHVHQNPNCTSADGTAAGGHFNPKAATHGGVTDPNSHLGDLGNIYADSNGLAVVNVYKPWGKADNSNDSFIQRSIIVHAAQDDFATQPTGNAGARVGCGIIKKK